MREAAWARAGRRVHPLFRLAGRQCLLRRGPDVAHSAARPEGHRRGGGRMLFGRPLAVCRLPPPAGHPLSVMLFHPMKWQSEENVVLSEAAEWARHFAQLETDMDRLLASCSSRPPEKISDWVRSGRYVTGPELAQAGLAEFIELAPLRACSPDNSRVPTPPRSVPDTSPSASEGNPLEPCLCFGQCLTGVIGRVVPGFGHLSRPPWPASSKSACLPADYLTAGPGRPGGPRPGRAVGSPIGPQILNHKFKTF